jgi:hypothetical protein
VTYSFDRLSDFDFESLVRDLLQEELKIRGTVFEPSFEDRLHTAIEAGADRDAAWLEEQLRALGVRWSRHRIGEHCAALLELLTERLPATRVTLLVAHLRDELLKGFESADEARLWRWLEENHPHVCDGLEEQAGAQFLAFAGTEVEHLSWSNNEDEIEGAKQDLLDLAKGFGFDHSDIEMEPVEEALQQLSRYADAHEDEWRENYREERYEASQDERFVDDLFDGLSEREG